MSEGRHTMPFMTQTATEATAAPEVVRERTVIVDVPKDSRLESLLVIEEDLKEKEKAARENHEANKKGILAELKALYPDDDIKVYEVPASRMYKKMAYTFQRSPYLPTDLIRKHMAPVYEAFKAWKESWVLR